MSTPIRTLVVGCGNMGTSHARAYHQLPDFEVAGVVSRGPESRQKLSDELGGVPQFGDYYEALEATKPDAVSINTYPETHAPYATAALEAGAHVFLEKPIAPTVKEAQTVVDKAKETGKALVVGYILRVHPSWMKFTEVAQTLGKPLVMRMNLNQQSSGSNWDTHKSLMASMPPIVDCGVHYVDVMCQMTGSKPVRVQAVGARLTDELPEGRQNYGHLHVAFEDGSVGWYEAGWGPMMSETAFFVKDVVGPKGCVTIEAAKASSEGESATVDAHCKTESLRLHHADVDEKGEFTKEDEIINLEDEPDHDALCLREQEYFLRAIRGEVDLTEHHASAVNSLRIVLAAAESIETGQSIAL